MSDSIAFLLSDVARLLRRRFDERARASGITRAQWRTLLVLSRNEGVHQGGLAELLEVEPITLCRMIDRLADAGLVERRRSPTDRRAWNIYLADRARPLLDQLRLLADELTDDTLAALDTSARDQLTASLLSMRANLNAPVIHEAVHG
ncbi:MarR family winged helix-turn-helix transcriptional regulator [Sphingomonas bacterium]|uniref:MarR family winged helix-turn-helix transcriptional regulator n=1 Tax=Sphingomonas bacterium TaxID=1895847 RepID=UPI001575B30E|nr:MarR family transcriptional regulator [Sphingomonas bacterium]